MIIEHCTNNDKKNLEGCPIFIVSVRIVVNININPIRQNVQVFLNNLERMVCTAKYTTCLIV
jgi:hypothetical protein